MMSRRLCIVLAVLSVLSGCVAALKTPSGRPEVFIPGATPAQVSNELVSGLAAIGYSVRDQTANSLFMEKQLDDPTSMMFFGSGYNRVPAGRAIFTFVSMNGGTHVYGTAQVVTNPGGAYEQVSDVSKASTSAHQLQEYLEAIRDRMTR